ncbi:Rap1a/Tai family immunity protein [Ensifer sp. BR816]|uniref:Rap1a/Tai family immunity protein n=1 Tax=Rhizobium sp. (strain BR816) TaxID=1057002 RepID=UPI000363FFB1|nr:Rap1a/Tai family immunity protein [Ensifer sp. BR816]
MSPTHRPAIRCAVRLLSGGCAVAAMMLSTSALAGDEARNWIFSGAELKAALEGRLAPEASNEETRRMLSSARGNAYVAGIADATSGTRWCGAGTVLPHELTDRIHTYLGDLPPARLDENAATLVGEALAQSFPCGSQAVVTGSRNTIRSLDKGDERVVRN